MPVRKAPDGQSLRPASDGEDAFESLAELDSYLAGSKAAPKTQKWPTMPRTDRPRLLVCHDFQGGYSEDPNTRGYSFEHWACTDVFVYFAHKRVSLPPYGWIQAAHTHDTPVLGTLIFEWDESKHELLRLLCGPHGTGASPFDFSFSKHYADQLITLALSRGIQGFLVNVEVSLDLRLSGPLAALERVANAEKLRRWVDYLRKEGIRRTQGLAEAGGTAWHVVWYDSVVYPHGVLGWQDALTPANMSFFQASTSCFTNYTWAKPGMLEALGTDFHPALVLSSAMCDSLSRRRSDVFVGLDVFGRNCYGAQETWKTLELVGPHRERQLANPQPVSLAPVVECQADVADIGTALGLSIALFAQGWTWEHDAPSTSTRSWDTWWEEDCAFWLKAAHQYGIHHAIAEYFPPRPAQLIPSVDKDALVFSTNFAKGSGCAWYVQGECVQQSSWSDMAVCAPKPLLAWPTPRAFREKPNKPLENGPSLAAALDEQTAWSGNNALKLDIDSVHDDQALNIPLISLCMAEQPKGTELVLDVSLVVRHDMQIQPLVILGPEDVRIGTEPAVSPLAHGWSSISATFALSKEVLHSSVQVGISIQLQAKRAPQCLWVGQVRAELRDRAAELSGGAMHEAIYAQGILEWEDFAPWSTCYETFLVGPSATQWLGTATLGARTRVALRNMPDGDEQVIEVRPVGARKTDPVALVVLE